MPCSTPLHHRQIHVQRQSLMIKAKAIQNLPQLLRVIHLKHQLAWAAEAGIAVKFQAECLLKQLRQHSGKFPAFRNNADAIPTEAVGVEQNAEALG